MSKLLLGSGDALLLGDGSFLLLGDGAGVPSYASFDGSGATYFSRAALDVTKTFPFWVGAWVLHAQDQVYDTTYTIWCSERADSSNGTSGSIWKNQAQNYIISGGTDAFASSDEAVIPDPYWEHVLFEYRSTTDRRVWINGVQQGTSATSKSIDLSTGSPVTRIAYRAVGSQPWDGGLADVTFGSGTLSTGDRALLATFGGDYSTVTGITSWYPLDGDGVDSVGGLNMTASGTISYVAGRPAARPSPTAAEVIQYIFKQATLRSESPTVTPGGTSPISGFTNLASVEYIDCAFTGSAGAWNTRMHHHIPTISLDHLVYVCPGHMHVADFATYNVDDTVKTLVAAGYAVLLGMYPGFGASDPGYPTDPDHDLYWATLSDTVNPLERFLGPISIALNNLSARYTKKSMVGLSGGGWLVAHYPAIDSRINHASIPVRGTMASRRARYHRDFEQHPKPAGWKQEEFYRLAAVGNRRFWLVHHATDPVVGAEQDTLKNGAYLSAATYRTSFIDPIMSEFPQADVQFRLDAGSAPHAFTQEAIDNDILPALESALLSLEGNRGLTPAVAAAFEAENVAFLALVELDFGSGFVRVTNNAYSLQWDGYTWTGLGVLGGMEKIEEGADLQAYGVALSLSGVPTDKVAIALGEHYQGRSARIWVAPLDANYQIIADPKMVFSGRMDTMPISIGAGTSSIRLTIESRLADWERARVRRYNDADQQAEYPGDKGFEFVEQMVEKNIVWGRS